MRMAFHIRNCVGTRDDRSFAVQWLACTLPCRRFAGVLTDVRARLGADADRHSLTVRDHHPLLLVRLPAPSANLHNNGHAATASAGPFCAKSGNQRVLAAPVPTGSRTARDGSFVPVHRSPRKKSPTQKSSSSSLRFGNFQQPVSLGLKVHNGGNSNEVRFDDCYRSCHCDASSGGRCWSSSWSRRRWRERWRKP